MPRKAAHRIRKEVGQNIKDKKTDKRARDGGLSREGSHNRGSFQTPENPLTGGSGGSFRILEGNLTGRKNKKNSQITCLKATLSRKVPQTPASTTSKWGQNREERAAVLRVRTGPECPEGNQRELTWDSSLNCGIAGERERKLTGLNTRPAVRRTKGLSNSREEPAGGRPAHPCRGRRQRGGERGKLSPREGTPYQTANRLPASNQRLPEILDGWHPPGGSRLKTSSAEQTQCAPDGARGNWGWYSGGEKAHRTRGECAHQAPGCLSC